MSDAPTRTAVLELSPDDTAPQQARSFVLEHIDDLPVDICDDALLLATELVTNAVRYGRPAIIDRVAHRRSGVTSRRP